MVQIPPFVSWIEYSSMQGHCFADSKIFLYLHWDLKLSVPSVKGFGSALNLIFTLASTNLVANRVVSRMFNSFEKSCLPREVNHEGYGEFSQT